MLLAPIHRLTRDLAREIDILLFPYPGFGRTCREYVTSSTTLIMGGPTVSCEEYIRLLGAAPGIDMFKLLIRYAKYRDRVFNFSPDLVTRFPFEDWVRIGDCILAHKPALISNWIYEPVVWWNTRYHHRVSAHLCVRSVRRKCPNWCIRDVFTEYEKCRDCLTIIINETEFVWTPVTGWQVC
jgi:hypothetical protein